jgi:hypothetical protein
MFPSVLQCHALLYFLILVAIFQVKRDPTTVNAGLHLFRVTAFRPMSGRGTHRARQ